MKEKSERLGLRRDWKKFNGPAFLLSILRSVDPTFRVKLLNDLKSRLPWMAKLAEEFEFTFWELARLDQGSLETLWRLVPERDMAVAWKLASEPLRHFLLAGLSDRRRENFLQEFGGLPKMPRSQVIRTQLLIARQVHAQLCLGKMHLMSRDFTGRNAPKQTAAVK